MSAKVRIATGCELGSPDYTVVDLSENHLTVAHDQTEGVVGLFNVEFLKFYGIVEGTKLVDAINGGAGDDILNGGGNHLHLQNHSGRTLVTYGSDSPIVLTGINIANIGTDDFEFV